MNLDELSQVAVQQLLQDGFHPPMLVVEGEQNKRSCNFGIFISELDENRMDMMFAIGHMLREEHNVTKIVRLFMISEAWQFTPDDPDDKKETLIVSEYDITTRQADIRSFYMLRNVEGELAEVELEGGEITEIEAPLLETVYYGFLQGQARRQ